MKLSPWQLSLQFTLAAVLAVSTSLAVAQTETILHAFSASPDGAIPDGLGLDPAGNLYGTASRGGLPDNLGVIFKLTANGHGGYDETVIYTFTGGQDGRFPYNLTLDKNGNLYGTTAPTSADGGTVFQLHPLALGGWQKKLLYRFTTKTDGSSPSSIAFDRKGGLFGALAAGGPNGYGTIFQLTPTASGPWTFTQIYAFQNGRDGTDPQAIAIDAAGNIDGTSYIGLFHHGLVFQLKRAAGGTYSFNTLHKFPNQGGSDGEYPQGKIVLDPQGNLYGTASFGGSKLYGIAYQLVPGADGTWTENILHNFANGSDGATPYNGVTLDRQGNLFGSTYYGGGLGQCADRSQTCGTVFKLAPDGQGGWTETILHAFAGFKHDGSYANSAPILDPAGVLYGTTAYGGGAGDCRTDPTFNSYCGIVYSLQP